MTSLRSRRMGALPVDDGGLFDMISALQKRMSTLEAPSGESSDATADRARANIEELLTRVTLSNEAAYDQQVNLGTALPYNTPELAPVNFTLLERRKMYLRMSCYLEMTILNSGAGAAVDPLAVTVIKINLTNNSDGSVITTSTPVYIGAGFQAGERVMTRRASRDFLDDYYSLNPGDYTATFAGQVLNLDGTFGYARFFNPRMAVSVMEKT